MDRKTKWAIIGLIITLIIGMGVPLLVVMTTASLLLPTAGRCQGVDSNGVGIGGSGYAVMSYNIKHDLSPKEADMEDHPKDFKWANRGPVVLSYITNVNPDLLGLQEAARVRGTKTRQVALIKAGMTGYRWEFSDTADPIAFRSSAFTLLDKGRIRLNYKGQDGATLDRFANWVKLRASADGTDFYFVNLHAQFGSFKSMAHARSVGWTRLINGLEKANPRNRPTILAGDFNALNSETRRVYRDHLTKLGAAGFIEAATVATTTAPIARVTSFNGWGDTIGGKFYYKAINRSRVGNHIDHVWTSRGATATQWQIYTGPSVIWKTVKGTPVPFTPTVASDHWPILARVMIGATATTDLAYTLTTASTPGAVTGYTAEQLQIAAQIVQAGQSLKLDTWTLTVGVMTGIGESSLRNLGYGDKAGPDSRGVFQQRSGWGSLEDRMNPFKASLMFFRALLKVPGYHDLEPTIAAHRTQINADPYHYAKYWDDAVKIVAAVGGGQGSGTACPPAGGGSGEWAEVIAFALSKVGVYPYSWGGGSLQGPTVGFGQGANIVGFDCSSFVRFVVYQKSKVVLPRTSRDQARLLRSRGFVTRTTSYSQLQPGDLLFYSKGDSIDSIYHVALVVAPGEIVEEPGAGRYVQRNKIANRMPGDIWGYARFDLASLQPPASA